MAHSHCTGPGTGPGTMDCYIMLFTVHTSPRLGTERGMGLETNGFLTHFPIPGPVPCPVPYPVPIPSPVQCVQAMRALLHRLKANAKAKKIKEQTQYKKEKFSNIKKNFAFTFAFVRCECALRMKNSETIYAFFVL